jgi:hypothetical protein
MPRFTDHGDGTFTDNLTGLIWLKNAFCPGTSLITWQQALDDVASLNATGRMNGNDCGDTSNEGTHQRDWRLANIRELLSLLDYRFWEPPLSNPAGTGQAQCEPVDPVECPFSLSFVPRLWSSTTVGFTPGAAWTLDLTNQSLVLLVAVQKTTSTDFSHGFLVVRGGP